MPIDRTILKKETEVYAEVLLEAAKGSDTVFKVSGELGDVVAAIRGSIDLRTTLSDALLDMQVRKNIIDEVFAGFDAALIAMLGVMVERNDLGLLPRVYEDYIYRAEDALGAAFIDVTTVVALDDALRSKIIEKYSAQLGRGVLLREHVDPSSLGGIVVSTHGRRIDASIVSQLEAAHTVLSTVPSGGER
jgi:F-type H+-transporting ATPase subunit delta